MKYNSRLEKIGENTSLNTEMNIDFSSFEISGYKEIFEELKSQGIFENCNFEDIQWFSPDIIKNYSIELNFDLDIYPELRDALKAYTIVRISEGKAASTLYEEIRLLKKMIVESSGFTKLELLEIYLEDQITTFKAQGTRNIVVLKSFTSFYNLPSEKKIKAICNKYPYSKVNTRSLPNFKHIIEFDSLMSDFINDCNKVEYVRFLSLIIWWGLTTILPMRPREFLLLKMDCLKYSDLSKSVYKIEVPRLKEKKKSQSDPILNDVLVIDEKIYKIINKAITTIRNLDINSDYIFSSDLMSKGYEGNRTKKNSILNVRDFGYIKKVFYKEIVIGKYNKTEIEMIKSGDTRHFAIINLCLQGFNMLSVAELAGHSELKTTYSYYSHAKHFAESHVYRLAQLKYENKIIHETVSPIIGWKKYVYYKGKNIDSILRSNQVGKVDYGYCTEDINLFPSECVEECKYCDKFYFSPAINEREAALKWLSNTSKELKQKIDETIDMMADLSSLPRKYDMNLNQDMLNTHSRELHSLMEIKSTVDAKILSLRGDGL